MGLRTRRANLWAGVYAGLFGADAESTGDQETDRERPAER